MADARLRYIASDRSTNPESLLTTGLNSLATATGALSAAFDNDKGDLWMDLELVHGTLGGTPAEDAPVDVYVVRSIDDTNFAVEATEGRPREGYVGSFLLDNATTARRYILPQVPCPTVKDFKVYLINNSGVSLNASGNTLKAFFYTEVADEA